jgi:uncharacterized repeat protein (TIGR03803 family)
MDKLDVWKWACGVALLSATVFPSRAQTFRTLLAFGGGSDGGRPTTESLVQGADGYFYGTTFSGGNQGGTVFRITRGGTLTTLHEFCPTYYCTDGGSPAAGLIQVTDGNFYGTTSSGGTNGSGTVFKISPRGHLTTIYSFCAQNYCADGVGPEAPVVQATDGNFYGTTFTGGIDNDACEFGCGTVFKITPGGELTTLHSFCAQMNCTDGDEPSAGLVQGTDGNFYGTTELGGVNSVGTVFKIRSGGKLIALYSFCAKEKCSDGIEPLVGLLQAADGNFYGTTALGGANDYGTIFKITPRGKLTTLHRFAGYPTEGERPYGPLVQGTDGNFYGTTTLGGANNYGTIFKITRRGTLTTLHDFNFTDGAGVDGGLIQATDGSFYGTANSGGQGYGTVFSLSTGLSPFVAFVRNFGKVGTKVEILGQGFEGTTAVSFNGTAADFEVVSNTYLTATVPPGATTGFVTVATPIRKLKSNKKFRVIP